ncbi:hypothetical protein DAEQUDRAFT_14968 [Daedalea quercina L-15889]|uniref:Uncharacterized protein n=1 Tax=Daedalea quercina L-15889 TaxID=1314783 RepID=A0A165UIJ9_9APHY|nr:hypothetical protein DAEQUDRAFT_14968 [Daedalea quercina L-15889]
MPENIALALSVTVLHSPSHTKRVSIVRSYAGCGILVLIRGHVCGVDDRRARVDHDSRCHRQQRLYGKTSELEWH